MRYLSDGAMIIFTGSDARFQVTSHIPDQGTQLVHYYGTYSNAHREVAAGARSSSRSRRRTSCPILRDPTGPGLRPAGNPGRALSAASTRSIRFSAVAACEVACPGGGFTPPKP